MFDGRRYDREQMLQKVDRDSRPLHRNQRRGQTVGKVSEFRLQPIQLLSKLLGRSCITRVRK